MNRLVILNRRYCPGEAWTNRILAYAKGFAEAGADVVLYYIITDQERTKPDISINGVAVINLWESDGPLAKRFKTISFIKNLIRFPKMIKKGDRLFIYGGYGYQLLLAILIKKKAKVFCEITEHPKVFGSSKLFHIKNEWKIKMLKKLDGLFVISHSLKNYYITEGIPENKVHVVNMFVDTKRFEGLQKTTDAKYIAYCGVVSYHKDGVDTLIKAFSLFKEIQRDYKLMILGRGISEDVIRKLKQLTESLGIQDSVIFTGQVNPKQMPQLLINASILALARPDSLQARNGFPTKLGEYLATSNPVVVTAIGEIPNYLKDGENAFLVKPDDPKEFAKRLCFVADNYDYAKLIGLQGRKLANEIFNYNVQAKKAMGFM